MGRQRIVVGSGIALGLATDVDQHRVVRHLMEPGLPEALAKLSERQRTVVILVHSLEWTQSEVADLLGVSQGAVRTHLERGVTRLRSKLGANHE